MNHNYCITILFLCILGCGSGDDAQTNRPATFPVTGTVTYNGMPVDSALVTFRPNQGVGQGCYARTDENGVFSLTTFETGDGAGVGSYSVIVTKRESTPGDPSYGDPTSPNYGKETPPEAESKTIDLLPEKYADVATSGLSADVKQGENRFSFELSD